MNKSSFKITAENSIDINSEIRKSTIKTESFKMQESEDILDNSKANYLQSSQSYENGYKIEELSGTIYKEKDHGHGNECNLCGKSYSIKHALSRHVKEKHTNESSFSCNECDWTGHRPYLPAKHIENAHGIIQ